MGALGACSPLPGERERGADAFQIIERADFVAYPYRVPPPESAGWRAVSLPDDWSRHSPALMADGWYRIRVALREPPAVPYAFYVPVSRGSLRIFVNGEVIELPEQSAGQRDGIWVSPVYHVIPPGLLRKGDNTIHVGMRGHARYFAGLGRVTIGETRHVEPLYQQRRLLVVDTQRAFGFAALLAGLFGLALWRLRPAEKAAFWFALGALAWSSLGLAFTLGKETLWLLGKWREVLLFLHWHIVAIPAVSACLRLAGRRWVAFESALWAALFGAAVPILQNPLSTPHAGVWAWYGSAGGALPLAAAVALAVARRRDMTWSLAALVALAFAAALFPVHDWLRNAGVLDADRPSLRHFQPFFLLLGLGLVMLERYAQGVRAIENANLELERRVAEKTREIEENAARMQALREEQALARERQRILADMHDGLGATLVGLIHTVRAGKLEHVDLERGLEEALQDLRIAIDSLEPYEGHVGAVLGALRARLDRAVAAAGLRLEWRVDDLPPLGWLTPSAVLGVLRILLEAVNNALRHSGAAALRVSARLCDADRALEIEVADDGRGFEPEIETLGRGLRSMRRRAEAIGGTLQLDTARGRGTAVRLRLPVFGPASAAAAPSSAA